MLMEDAEDQGKQQLLDDFRQIVEDGKLALAIINGALTPATNEVGEAELRAMHDALLAPVNQILERVRRFEPEIASADLAKVRTAAERLLAMSSEILAPGSHPEPEILVVPIALDIKPPQAHTSDKVKAGPQSHILVVDDNETNRDVLGRRLEREGYLVSSAENGRLALEMVRATSYDLVLLDIMMPEIDGYQVLSQMKADPALCDIPVIMISALDQINSVVRCIESGAEDYLNKPFDPVLLRARIGACLEKKRLRDEQKLHLRELAEWNQKLEQRVQEQVALLDRLGRLKRFFSPQLAELIVAGGADDPLATHRRDLTVCFLDLRGFTAFAESVEPEEVMGVLREYHAEMGRLVMEHEGTLERFTGDGMMVFFNDPVPVPNAAERTVRMALAMRKRGAARIVS